MDGNEVAAGDAMLGRFLGFHANRLHRMHDAFHVHRCGRGGTRIRNPNRVRGWSRLMAAIYRDLLTRTRPLPFAGAALARRQPRRDSNVKASVGHPSHYEDGQRARLGCDRDPYRDRGLRLSRRP